VFYPAAYDNCATVVGFNLPFDIARIAVDATPGRGRNLGGFSFILAQGNEAKGHRERKHRPRVHVQHINSHASFISFATPYKAAKEWKGDFVDLRTLTFALTAKSHTLNSACEAFELPGKSDPSQHGIITPEYIQFYGGRAECRIRHTEVPVTLLDFLSMYSTLFALMDLHRYNIAAEIGTVDATTEIRELLARVADDPEVLFDPTIWPQFVGIALVEPDGDIVPVRAQYAEHKDTYNIAVSRLRDPDISLWYTIPDLERPTSDRQGGWLR
jgi:hypothetical protein